MVILFGNEEQALKKLLAKKSYDELRELVAELHPGSHVQHNPNKARKMITKWDELIERRCDGYDHT